MIKFRPLEAFEIDVKVKQVLENGAVLLLYKNARTDMDILDETVGPGNWTNDYKDIKGNLYCGLAVREKAEDPFIWKWDCGIESREDGEGNEKKGEASDAFKRAGFRWGIGRELYSAPFIWVSSENLNIFAGKNGKPKTNDKFSVEKIVYDGNKIAGLAIFNNTARKRVFVWHRT